MTVGGFDTPIMYQDLANSSMGPMNMRGMLGNMYGAAPMANTSYLGGVKMKRQPDADSLNTLHKKENEDKNTLKKALLVLGGAVALGCTPIFRKMIKNAGGFKQYTKNIFAKLKASFSNIRHKKT